MVDEGEDWLVVDKPALLLVHPTKPNGAVTLWDGLRDLLSFEIANGGQVSIVNRLDRETSGLVLVAKNAATATADTCMALFIRRSPVWVAASKLPYALSIFSNTSFAARKESTPAGTPA